MVGATQRFIRRPLLTKGMIQGALSGLLSVLLLMATYWMINQKVENLITIDYFSLLLVLFAFVFLLGIAIAWLSTWFAVRRFLRIKTDYLYQF